MNAYDVHVSPRVLTLPDLDWAVTVLTHAFHKNPLWCYMVPNAHHRRKVERQCFRFSLRISIKNRQVFGIGTPLVAIAIWRRPYQRARALSSVIRGYLLQLVMNPRILTFLRTRAVFRASEALHHRYASKPHYHLQTLAVHPHYQGQGYATRLLQPILDHTDSEAMGTYTETMTPRNVKLYEHFGFHCKAQQHFPSTRLTLWALYRPPKHAR